MSTDFLLKINFFCEFMLFFHKLFSNHGIYMYNFMFIYKFDA